MSPTLRQFAAFLKVARLGSFARAAEALGMSQPALSQAISQMEGTLDARLFDRTTRSVRLTREGALLVPHAEAILASVEDAVGAVRRQGATLRPRISVGTLPSHATIFLADILRLFRLRYPAAEVAVTDGTSDVLYAGIESGQIDLALASRLRERDTVRFRPLFRERFALVLPRSHPLARQAAVNWNDALAHDFIAFPTGSAGYEALHDGLERANLALRPVMTLAQSATVLKMVEAGVGVTALPMLGGPKPDHPNLTMRPLADPVIEREVGILQSSAFVPTAGMRVFEEIMCACIRHCELPGIAATTATQRRHR
ncbi:LysR family transcriptional regulator [Neoroseomonas lacus]|uniref:LysR family transcriptional regulator n=1 Tax=Neoroseomonas lacus TaxID=287609 RepID=A0A917KAK7_9PROT|nr:LysR family transcriptional regulator [Neoroseomonas lacus]GGJ05490.1 LysR family transcriptional regulator [Neoroseomonas lacus]